MKYEHFVEFENAPAPEPELSYAIQKTILPMAEDASVHEVKELNETFRADFANCNDSYHGYRHRVRGVVIWMGVDIHGKDSIQLSDEKGGICWVHCCVKDPAEYDKVNPGDTVTMEGNYMDCHPKFGVVFKMSEVVE